MSNYDDENIDYDGDGSESDPVTITNIDELQALPDYFDVGAGLYYELSSDIDATVTENWTWDERDDIQAPEHQGFMPLGVWNDGDELGDFDDFEGNFNGNGYVITDLYINGEENSNYALFHSISNSIVENMSVQGFEFQNISSLSAAIAGEVNNTEVRNISVHACILNDAANNSGICVGEVENSIVENITVEGSELLNGGVSIGGVIGYSHGVAEELTLSKLTIIDSNVNGSSRVGGIIGELNDVEVTITDFTVENVDVTCRNFGRVGGVCGQQGDGSTIDNVDIERVEIINQDFEDNAGGVVGIMGENTKISDVRVDDFFIRGTDLIGGVAGTAAFSNGSFTLQDCILTGGEIELLIEEENQGFAVGGLVGDAYDPDIDYCFTEVNIRKDQASELDEPEGTIAGLIGDYEYSGNYGNISKCMHVGDITTGTRVSGLVNYPDYRLLIQDCAHIGDLPVHDDVILSGGLTINTDFPMIENSYVVIQNASESYSFFDEWNISNEPKNDDAVDKMTGMYHHVPDRIGTVHDDDSTDILSVNIPDGSGTTGTYSIRQDWLNEYDELRLLFNEEIQLNDVENGDVEVVNNDDVISSDEYTLAINSNEILIDFFETRFEAAGVDDWVQVNIDNVTNPSTGTYLIHQERITDSGEVEGFKGFALVNDAFLEGNEITGDDAENNMNEYDFTDNWETTTEYPVIQGFPVVWDGESAIATKILQVNGGKVLLSSDE